MATGRENLFDPIIDPDTGQLVPADSDRAREISANKAAALSAFYADIPSEEFERLVIDPVTGAGAATPSLIAEHGIKEVEALYVHGYIDVEEMEHRIGTWLEWDVLSPEEKRKLEGREARRIASLRS